MTCKSSDLQHAAEPAGTSAAPAAEVEQPPAELPQIAAESAVPEPEPAVAQAVTAGGESVPTEGDAQLESITAEAVADRPEQTEEHSLRQKSQCLSSLLRRTVQVRITTLRGLDCT